MSRRRQVLMAAVLGAAISCAAPWMPQSVLRAAEMGEAQNAASPAQTPRPAAPPLAPSAPVAPAVPPAPPLPGPPFPTATAPGAPDEPTGADPRRGEDVVRIASDYALKAGDSAGDLTVIMGNARIDGRVQGDLVVILGEAQLGPEAVVEGDLAVIGGTLTVKAGAAISREVVVVAGSLDAPADFTAQGQQVIIGFKGLGDAVRGLLPWLTSGLLLGRPIVPTLPWVWAVVGVLFAVYLGVLVIFERPVRLTTETLTATPLRALATGLGTLLAVGPLLLLLAASFVGLLVVPFAACALLVAGIVGKAGANTWLGNRILSEGEDASRLTLARSFVIGCAVLIVAYMVPVLGGVVWASMSALGLGASVLAFASAYRRENPSVERAPLVPPAPGHPAPVLEGAADWSVRVPPSAALAGASPFDPAVLLAMPHATFLDRLAAFTLDAILVAMVIVLMSGIGGGSFVPLLLAYRFAFWAWKGTTVGGIVCQLRVIRVDGALAGPAEAMVRSLGSVFSIGVLGLGCLWILRDADRQAWHDKIAGTFVVKVPRQWPV